MSRVVVFACCLAATLISVAGDYYLKRSSSWWDVALGVALYAGSALPWYFAIRSTDLVVIAVLYPVITVLCLTWLGVTMFGEQMTSRTWLALGFALCAVITLEWGGGA
jgi:undecaprenyl phosphate-alpha-L-ara4N flippase subunit ArnF